MTNKKDKKQTNEPIRSIVIIGRKWFEKVNGNTYHSVQVFINGEKEIEVPFQYGYDEKWKYSAIEELQKYGLFSADIYNLRLFKEYCKTNDIDLIMSVTNVARKKDLLGG